MMWCTLLLHPGMCVWQKLLLEFYHKFLTKICNLQFIVSTLKQKIDIFVSAMDFVVFENCPKITTRAKVQGFRLGLSKKSFLAENGSNNKGWFTLIKVPLTAQESLKRQNETRLGCSYPFGFNSFNISDVISHPVGNRNQEGWGVWVWSWSWTSSRFPGDEWE